MEFESLSSIKLKIEKMKIFSILCRLLWMYTKINVHFMERSVILFSQGISDLLFAD